MVHASHVQPRDADAAHACRAGRQCALGTGHAGNFYDVWRSQPQAKLDAVAGTAGRLFLAVVLFRLRRGIFCIAGTRRGSAGLFINLSTLGADFDAAGIDAETETSGIATQRPSDE